MQTAGLNVYYRIKAIAAITLVLVLGAPVAKAASPGPTRLAMLSSGRIQASMVVGFGPALAPLAFTRFCFTYPDQCDPGRPIFRPKRISVVREMIRDLDEVNHRVNVKIRPQADAAGLLNDIWEINPPAGDCDDYAVTKRAELIRRGWSQRALLLAQVSTPSGEMHLVLVARTRLGDFVLDNLRERVLPAAETNLRWISMQTPSKPQFWQRVATRTLPMTIPPAAPTVNVAFAAWQLRL
jgi:predicted transglutaminase-like cysteine proteinase